MNSSVIECFCGNWQMASLQILFSLIPLMSSLPALISPEERWAICSCSAYSEAGDAGGSGLLTAHWNEGVGSLSLLPWFWRSSVCMGSQFASLTQLRALLFAKVIFCSFVKWNWWTMGSDLCHSCLKVKHWQCMGFHWHGMELGEKQERAGWWIPDLVWKLL